MKHTDYDHEAYNNEFKIFIQSPDGVLNFERAKSKANGEIMINYYISVRVEKRKHQEELNRLPLNDPKRQDLEKTIERENKSIADFENEYFIPAKPLEVIANSKNIISRELFEKFLQTAGDLIKSYEDRHEAPPTPKPVPKTAPPVTAQSESKVVISAGDVNPTTVPHASILDYYDKNADGLIHVKGYTRGGKPVSEHERTRADGDAGNNLSAGTFKFRK